MQSVEVQMAVLVTPSEVRAAAASRGVVRFAGEALPAGAGAEWLGEAIGRLRAALRVRRGAAAAVAIDGPGVRVIMAEGSSVEAAASTARLRLLEELGVRAMGSLVRQTAIEHAAGGRRLGLAAAAEEHEVASVWGACASAGLRPAGVWPARVVELEAAVSLASSAGWTADQPLVLLGWARSLIASGAGGVVRYVRSIDFGLAELARAYEVALGAARFAGADVGPAEQDASRAASLLSEHGVPGREAAIVGSAVRGIDVLALLQPAVQRLQIEVRQTLRFGPAEISEPPRSVRLACEGGVPPGLSGVLGDRLELDVVDACGSFEGGLAGLTLRAMLRAREATGAMEPEAVTQRRVSSRRRGLATVGAAAAGAVLVGDGLLALSSAREAEAALARVRDAAADAGEQLAALAEDERLAGLLRHAAEVSAERVATRTPWAAGLEAVALAGGEDVRVSEIHGSAARGTSHLEVVAFTARGDGSPPEPRLRAFMRAIESSAVVSSVSLVSASADRSGEGGSTRFVVRVGLRPVSVGPAGLVMGDGR